MDRAELVPLAWRKTSAAAAGKLECVLDSRTSLANFHNKLGDEWAVKCKVESASVDMALMSENGSAAKEGRPSQVSRRRSSSHFTEPERPQKYAE